MSQTELFIRYAKACNYPGAIDPFDVEMHLRRYLRALGIERKIQRLQRGWQVEEHSSFKEYVEEALAEFTNRAPRAAREVLAAQGSRPNIGPRASRSTIGGLAARAARDARAVLTVRHAREALAARSTRAARRARDAQDATTARNLRAARLASDAQSALDVFDTIAALNLQPMLDARDRFARWCISIASWWTWSFELSGVAATHLGAVQLGLSAVQAWTNPLFEAFLAGAWLLHWTHDTLYWIAKPMVHIEPANNPRGRRLHNATGPALKSDLEDLYFWHGVIAPAAAVMHPESITIEQINAERNVAIRRVLIERYGPSCFIIDSGSKKIHEDELGELYRAEIPDDEPIVMVRVLNSTPEQDGTHKAYFLRVPPNIERARDAVAWTFGFDDAKAYAKALIQQT